MRIGIVFKEEDSLIAGTAKKMISELKEAGHKVEVINAAGKPKGIQVVLTFGGDGTVLRAARLVCKSGFPLLPVHLGGLGILTELTLAEIKDALKSVKANKYSIDPRMMLEATVIRSGHKIKNSLALNDVVIGKSSIARTIKLEAFMKDKSIANYVGDGLVISTPTGSTAYNFAVNGPILPPEAESYILSPICPHRAANRSIVLSDPVTIKIQKGEDLLVTLDGQEIYNLKRDDAIIIQKSKYKTKFIRLKEYNIWDLLRTKLGWS